MTWQSGDRVNWHRTPSGNYGFTVSLAAVVLSLTEKTAKVAIYNTRTGARVIRRAPLDKLTARTLYVAGLDAQEVAG